METNAALEHAYHEADTDFRVRQTKVGCMLALILVPCGCSLDYFVYPELFWDIFQARVICDLILIPIYLLLDRPFARPYVRVLGALWAITPMLTICWMVYVSEGAVSPYYAGLNLMLIVTCQILPYDAIESTAYCLFTLVSYVVVCLLHPRERFEFSVMYNNLYFIVLTAIISATACHFAHHRRKADFMLRHELDVRNRQLTELDRLKSQFFANVSHELRTPLTLIVAPVEDLLRRGSELTAPMRQSLELIRQNGLRLLRLINDLLEIVRLEEAKLTLRRKAIPLGEFVAGIVESVRGLATHNRLTLEVTGQQESAIVMADESCLEKVLLNLVTNAVKFTPAGGRIGVRWWCENGAAHIEVADSGIGIADSDLPHVFDRFRQAESTVQKQNQGLGLGLALAKELVEAHGGRLTANSVVGKGSTFHVELPQFAAEAESFPGASQEGGEPIAVLEESEQPAGLTAMFREANRVAILKDTGGDLKATLVEGRPKVLVVDDEPDMRRYLVSTLTEEYSVLQAADGESGLTTALEFRPELAVLDLMLPGISGLDLCKKLRAEPKLAGLKILMLTARIDEHSKIEALEQGVDDFLTKPFSTIEVKTRIKNLLAAAQLEDTLRGSNRELSDTLDKLKDAEGQLVQSEKMSAIGSLAAGLLHEINNPLNFTMLALSTLPRSSDPKDAEVQETLSDIDAGMKRIRDIITDLRDFAYPEPVGRQSQFSIRDAVETALRFTSQELHHAEVDSARVNGGLVVGSRTHITQVLVNMLTNAAHAVKVTQADRAPQVRVSTETQGDRLVVRIWDNGAGIEPGLLKRIFDPFFTTKDVGKGTGLGLSICHTIIRNHGGEITVASEAGRHTEFTFDLPLSK